MKITIEEESKGNFLFHFTPEHLIDRMLVERFEKLRCIHIEEQYHPYIENEVGKKVDWMTFIKCLDDIYLTLPADYPEVQVPDYERWEEMEEKMVCVDSWDVLSTRYRRMSEEEVYIVLVKGLLDSMQKDGSKLLPLLRLLRQDEQDNAWLPRWAVDVISKKKGAIGIGV